MRLTQEVCRRRLAGARRAVLATVSQDGSPHVVPITFAVQHDVVVTAVDQKPKSTTELRRVSNIRASPRVAVLADRYDDDWEQLWWVRADGRAEIVSDGPERDAAVVRLAERYPQYRQDPPQGAVIRVRVERWTGWAAT
jgi:PPOX class probable F420-dependent enzyme